MTKLYLPFLLVIPCLLGAGPPEGKEEALRLIQLLGHDVYEVRQHAEESLKRLHCLYDITTLLPLTSPDLEVRKRSERLYRVCEPWGPTEASLLGEWDYRYDFQGGVYYHGDLILNKDKTCQEGLLKGTWKFVSGNLHLFYGRDDKSFSYVFRLYRPDAKGWRRGEGTFTSEDGRKQSMSVVMRQTKGRR